MNMQSQGSGGSKSRTNLRSPLPHTNTTQDAKLYKKKYEQLRDQLKNERRATEQLQGRVRQLQEVVGKQDRELQKKQEINEVLLQRIKCLKGALSEMQAKTNDSYEEKNTKSNKSSTSNQDAPQQAQPVVGGYFGRIFN